MLRIILIIFIFSICSATYAEKESSNSEILSTTEGEDVFNSLDADESLLTKHPYFNKNLELKDFYNGAFIALNKIVASPSELNLKVGEEIYFGNIKIKLHRCLKNLDPYNEDNYLLLTITEYKIDEDPQVLFQGWMSSTSISLSTFEHPIYEIFARNCY